MSPTVDSLLFEHVGVEADTPAYPVRQVVYRRRGSSARAVAG